MLASACSRFDPACLPNTHPYGGTGSIGLAPPPWIAIASLAGFPAVLTYITITYLRGVCKSKTNYFRVGFVTPVLLGDVCFDSTVATVDNMSILSLDSSGSGIGVHVGGCREVVPEPVGSVATLFHVSDYGC